MKRFQAKLEPVPHGGHFVVVPEKIAAATGLAYGMRVRGTVEGAPYRSSLMKYSGIFHLGLHKASLAEAGLKGGDTATVTIEPDDEPLPTDAVPPDLQKALSENPRAHDSWARLAPATRRGYVQLVIESKKPETRQRRIAKIVATLNAGVPKRRTWTPPSKSRSV